MRKKEQRRDAWSDYWNRCEVDSSCPSVGNVAGDPLFDFWAGVFSRLGTDARILDLGTGNGALLKLADGVMPYGAAWEMDGVDLADPRPSWFDGALMPYIRLHGALEMERLPFSDRSFDLIVSQFGIEYARMPDVQHETLRLLRAGGRMAMVLHHADSVITRVAREEAVAQGFLLAPDGLFEAAAKVLPWIAGIRAGRSVDISEARLARLSYNMQITRLGELLACLKAPDLLLEVRQSIHELVMHASESNLEALLEMLFDMREIVKQSRLRTEEQIEVALDNSKVNKFVEPWREAGLLISIDEISQPERVLGWTILAGL